MSFYFANRMGNAQGEVGTRDQQVIAYVAKKGCNQCPLDKQSAHMAHPRMPASGDRNPDIYVLGEAPGVDEDIEGRQFVGQSGQIIRKALRPYDLAVRWNNTIRCHPQANRNPTDLELACCRRYIVADIEHTQPLAILGAGGFALDWVMQEAGITKWRGKRIPVRIGEHVCWFFPMMHPAYLLRNRPYQSIDRLRIKFEQDIAAMYQFLTQEYVAPHPVEGNDRASDITVVTGKNSADIRVVKRWFAKFSQAASLGIDLETTGLRPYARDARILTCAIGSDELGTLAFPVDFPACWSRKDNSIVKKLLKDLLLNDRTVKIAHNASFELEWLAFFFGREVLDGPWEDTMAQQYIIDNRKGTLNLDFLIKEHFGFRLKELSPAIGKALGKRKRGEGVKAVLLGFGISELPPAGGKASGSGLLGESIEAVLRYNALDAKWTYALWKMLCDQLTQRDLEVYGFLMHTCSTLVRTQLAGVLADRKFLNQYGQQLEQAVDKAFRRFAELPEVIEYQRQFGESCNPQSPKQLTRLLKDVMKRPEGERRGGKYSTGEDVLSAIPSGETEVPAAIREIRANLKLASTYVDGTAEALYDGDLIHTNYNHLLTATGRLSSDSPNLQNYPKRKNREARRMIIAPPGFWLVCFDYGQIEARVIAAVSGDPYFIEVLNTGYDIHAEWRDEILKVYPGFIDHVIKEYGPGDEADLMAKMRYTTKNGWVFPSFFGSLATSCARTLGMEEDAALHISRKFWEKFAGVRRWQRKILSFYERHGYIENILGLRYTEPMDEKQLFNYPIQGVASFIVMDAMNRLAAMDIQAVLTVHDELAFYIPDDVETTEEMIDTIGEQMVRSPFGFIKDANVPLSVECTMGRNWADQSEVGVFDSRDYT